MGRAAQPVSCYRDRWRCFRNVSSERRKFTNKKKTDKEETMIKLNVPYFRQTDNDTDLFGPGWRQCNTTSNAMLVKL